jgi:uncharacterized protein YndB with AHSA1/START domain
MGEIANASAPRRREVRADREVATGPARGAVSRRRVDAPIEDVWSLFADPERMRLWNPDSVTGEFRLGGKFNIKNNASGEVLRCEPPTLFRVSWIYAGSYSEFEVRLSSSAGATVVEFEHLMTDEELAAAGMSVSEGLVAAGTGWDFSLEYLDRYVRGELDEPPTAHDGWEASAEDEELFSQSERLWKQVVRATPEGG